MLKWSTPVEQYSYIVKLVLPAFCSVLYKVCIVLLRCLLSVLQNINQLTILLPMHTCHGVQHKKVYVTDDID